MKIAKEKLFELIENELATGKVEFLTENEAFNKLADEQIMVSFIRNRQQLEKEVESIFHAYRFFGIDDVLMTAYYYDDGNIIIEPVQIVRNPMQVTKSHIIISVDDKDVIKE